MGHDSIAGIAAGRWLIDRSPTMVIGSLRAPMPAISFGAEVSDPSLIGTLAATSLMIGFAVTAAEWTV